MAIHVCAFDRHCWKMWWQIAAPMRVHIGKRHWDIPVLTAIANWRTPRIWDLDNPVRRAPKNGSYSEDENADS